MILKTNIYIFITWNNQKIAAYVLCLFFRNIVLAFARFISKIFPNLHYASSNIWLCTLYNLTSLDFLRSFFCQKLLVLIENATFCLCACVCVCTRGQNNPEHLEEKENSPLFAGRKIESIERLGAINRGCKRQAEWAWAGGEPLRDQCSRAQMNSGDLVKFTRVKQPSREEGNVCVWVPLQPRACGWARDDREVWIWRRRTFNSRPGLYFLYFSLRLLTLTAKLT